MAREEGDSHFETYQLLDPETNIRLGTRDLRKTMDRFGGVVEYALAAYNAGDNRVPIGRRLVPITAWMSLWNPFLSPRPVNTSRRFCATRRPTERSIPLPARRAGYRQGPPDRQ